jgi:hypothetical protein
MAVADLIIQQRWKPAAARTPNGKTIKALLAFEPESTDPKAVNRNAVRKSATARLTDVNPKATSDLISRQTECRASRGHLSEAVDYLLTRTIHGTSAKPGGTKAATTLDAAVKSSKLLPALEAWSAAYRAGESDPGKLKTLLDDVNKKAEALKTTLEAAFGDNIPEKESPEASAAAFMELVEIPLSEIALEAAELLRTPPQVSSDPLSGPAASAERSTVRAKARELPLTRSTALKAA